MSRKIKFRGMHIHALAENEHLDGTWIYGYLCGGGHYIEPGDGLEKLIDCDTVGQYTGIVDKNGKEIYEGDIVRHAKNGKMATVVWYGCFAQFCISFLREEGKATRETDMFFANKSHGHYEVIGNIYENPELLHTQN